MKRVLPGVFILSFFILGVFFLTGSPFAVSDELPKLRGITVEDDHPQGYVSCHVKVDENRDYRLNKEIENIENHPKIDKIVKVAPKDCMICHKEGKEAGEFSKVVHEVHFENPR